MKVMKKVTENMKAKIPHSKHQGKYGPNSKVNSTISEIFYIKPMIAQRITRKEATTSTDTLKTTVT